MALLYVNCLSVSVSVSSSLLFFSLQIGDSEESFSIISIAINTYQFYLIKVPPEIKVHFINVTNY